jgi:hypothetical protein
MVPVIDAIAAASKGFAIRKFHERFRDSVGLIGTAEKLLFNIGRIPVRQSRSRSFATRQTANLAAGQKRRRRRRFIAFAILA